MQYLQIDVRSPQMKEQGEVVVDERMVTWWEVHDALLVGLQHVRLQLRKAFWHSLGQVLPAFNYQSPNLFR